MQEKSLKTKSKTFIWLYFAPCVCVGAPTVQAHALRLNDNSKLAVTVNLSVNVSLSGDLSYDS